MAEITAAPVFVKTAVKIGTNGQTAHIRSASLTPETLEEVVVDVGGKRHLVAAGAIDEIPWTLQIDAIQDHATANSLYLFMLANIGVILSCEATVPGGKYTFKIAGAPLPVLGAPAAVATGSKTFAAVEVAFVPAGG